MQWPSHVPGPTRRKITNSGWKLRTALEFVDVTRIRLSVWVLSYTVAAALLLAWAIRLDAFGTVSNLIADVLVGALISLIIHSLLLRRKRQRIERELSTLRADALDMLDQALEYHEKLDVWATRAIDREDTLGEFAWLMDHPSWLVDWHQLQAILWQLAADHGTVDFEPVLRRLIERHAAAMEQDSIVRAKLTALRGFDTSSSLFSLVPLTPEEATKRAVYIAEAKTTLATLRDLLPPIISDVTLLNQTVEQGYMPVHFSALRHPDPYPMWLRNVMWLTVSISLMLWGATYLLRSYFPAGLADGTTNNVLSAATAGFVGAVFAVIAKFGESRNTLIAAHLPYAQLAQALNVFLHAFDQSIADPKAVLREIATIVAGTVNQLQHVYADARLAQYSNELIAEIEHVVNGPSWEVYLDVDAETLRRLCLPEDSRVPTQQTMRLATMAMRLSERAFDIYIHGR